MRESVSPREKIEIDYKEHAKDKASTVATIVKDLLRSQGDAREVQLDTEAMKAVDENDIRIFP
jgi:hypothetical protein